MKKLSILFLLVTTSLIASAQKKLIQKLFSNEKDTTRKASFMPIPVFRYSQEIGVEFGLGSLYSYYMDRSDTLNRSSNFLGTATYSTKKTYHLSLKADAWTKSNRYHLIGEIKFKKTPFDFFGIGNQTLHQNQDRLVQRQIKAAFDIEKSLAKSAYTGLSVAFENHKFTDQVSGGIYPSSSEIIDSDGGKALFIGISQSLDTRNSNNYPTKGFFGKISYQYAPDLFGAQNFNGSLIKANIRNFWTINPKLVLGVQGIYYSIQSKSTPFYLLPQLGNDEMMRGYYTGRYRDENLIAAQTELRFRYNSRFGIVAFAGTGKVFKNGNLTLHNFKPNYGLGGRYFFDPAKGLSVRIDYGVGEKRINEKRQQGFYISFAEAF